MPQLRDSASWDVEAGTKLAGWALENPGFAILCWIAINAAVFLLLARRRLRVARAERVAAAKAKDAMKDD
jgi:hypothetical protein